MRCDGMPPIGVPKYIWYAAPVGAGGAVTGSLVRSTFSTAMRVFTTPSYPVIVTPAGSRISRPGKRSSVTTCCVAAFAIGTNFSAVGGGLIVQSEITLTWFAGRVVTYGQIG